MVINLRQDGKVIGTKETKGASGSNPVWNAPFLFDLPPGDITQLPLVLEFIVMQVGSSAISVPHYLRSRNMHLSVNMPRYRQLNIFLLGFLQGRRYTKTSILGRVLIGCGAPKAGQDHWEEMCSQGQTETARWHTIQSDVL